MSKSMKATLTDLCQKEISTATDADGTPAAGTPFQIFSRGVAGFFEMFGVPNYAATVFMTMCVIHLPKQVKLLLILKNRNRNQVSETADSVVLLPASWTALQP